jgi:mono/diheme cytochrome c family protein
MSRHVVVMAVKVAITAWLITALPALAATNYTPKVNYILHCQGCHLTDGAGTTGKVPALKDEVGKFLNVNGGRDYLIQVPGTSQSPMTDSEVAEVLNWILENFDAAHIPDDFVPFTTQEVSAVRLEPLTDVAAVRENLLTKIE